MTQERAYPDPSPAPLEHVIVWGGGGHGSVVADLIRDAGGTVAGLVDAEIAKLGYALTPAGDTVLFTEAQFLSLLFETESWSVHNTVALGIGNNHSRIARFEWVASAVRLPPIVHPRAHVSPYATLGRATVVAPLAAVNVSARVGNAVIVNTGAIVEHDCVVGDGVHLSPRATLCGGVEVGECAWVGAGATVIQGVRLGRDAIIGAGAVILKDVPDGATVVGNPGRTIHENVVAGAERDIRLQLFK